MQSSFCSPSSPKRVKCKTILCASRPPLPFHSMNRASRTLLRRLRRKIHSLPKASHAYMSLVKKRYRSEDDDADDASEEAQPSLKKRKTCAPEETKDSKDSTKPSFSAFQPLPIIYPSLNLPSKDTGETKNHNRRQQHHATGPVERFQGCLSSPPTFPTSDPSYPTSLTDIPSHIASALQYTAKKGQKESVAARKCMFRASAHAGPVWSVKWSPCSGNLLMTSSSDESVKLWDVWGSGKAIWTAQVFSGGIRDSSFCSDGKSVLFGGYGRRLYRVDVETGKVLLNLHQEAEISKVSERDGNFLFSLVSGSILSIDPRDPYMAVASSSDSPFTPKNIDMDAAGRYTRRISGLPGKISSFAFLPSCDASSQPLVVTCDPSNRAVSEYAVSVWDWESGRAISTGLWNSPHAAYFALSHPTLSKFAVLTSDNSVAIYSSTHPYGLKRKKNRFKLNDPVTTSRSQISFSPDGKVLYVGAATGRVTAFDYETQHLLASIETFEAKESVAAVTHHPVLNSVIAVSSWNGNLCVYK